MLQMILSGYGRTTFSGLLETAFSVLIRMELSGPGVWSGNIGYKTIIFDYVKGLKKMTVLFKFKLN